MTAESVIIGCVSMFLAVVVISVLGWWYMRPPTAASLQARLLKDLPELQAEFLEAGARSGKPRGVRWTGCEWGDERLLARDRTSREIVALVAVAIRFEAAPASGEESETLAHPTEPRAATAVFFYLAGRWQTVGKAVFNFGPSEVLTRFADQYEPLAG